jgi:hypothetical protein
MENVSNMYMPGVCNIGPAEIRARRRVGWGGLAVTLALWILLLVVSAAPWWGLLLFIPASTGATGFLQAALRFCAGFGMRGVFNFGDTVGKTQNVEQAASRSRDRKRSLRIMLYSTLVGAAVTAVGIILLAVF